MAGICPGPGIVSLGACRLEASVFLPSVMVGICVQDAVYGKALSIWSRAAQGKVAVTGTAYSGNPAAVNSPPIGGTDDIQTSMLLPNSAGSGEGFEVQTIRQEDAV